MSYKEDRDWTIFVNAGLNTIRNPSSTVSFEVRSSAMQKTNKQTNKQTNKNNNINNKNNNLDAFVKKKGFFMEKLSARGYNDAELSKANSSINFEDRQHFIKDKLKSTAIPLVFNTKYNHNFAGKYIRHARLKHWNIIDKNVRLKMIFPKPPMIAYSRSENLRDSLVRLNSLPGRRVTTRMTIFWEMRKILHPHQPCKTSRSGAWAQSFQHVHRFRDNRGPKYTRSYSLRPETRSFLMSFSGRYARRNIPDKYRQWFTSWTDQGKRPHSRKHMITKG